MENVDLEQAFELLKQRIRDASFDGWIENDGKNASYDHNTQLLKEKDALDAVNRTFPKAPCGKCARDTIHILKKLEGGYFPQYQCTVCGSMNYYEDGLPRASVIKGKK